MRRLFILSIGFLSWATTGVTQSRWTVSAGPEWTEFRSLWGLRFRADYDLLKQERPFQLRPQGGARWGPTQQFRYSLGAFRTFFGEDQTLDLTFGVAAALSPLPRARFSPYATFGVSARQAWSRGWSGSRDSTGSWTGSTTPRSSTYGDVFYALGAGMRTRFGGRVFQLEIRRLSFSPLTNSVTLGTALPF